jgi:lipopolysaccharide assembly LptE-like protein
MTRSGIARLVGLLLLLALGACIPYGFAGGGLPRDIHTVAVIPFDNETASPEIQVELTDQLRKALDSRLGLRAAAEPRADAVVRGIITKYEPDVPVAVSADPTQATTARRRVQVTIDVSIVNQKTGKTLWERKGLSAEGEYPERAEAEGRKQALTRIVNDVIEGAQSQW